LRLLSEFDLEYDYSQQKWYLKVKLHFNPTQS
jgi:hypothetical protein